MIVGIFFMASCEKRVVLKEPPAQKPIVVEPPSERPAEEEAIAKVAPEEIPPEQIPEEEIPKVKAPEKRPPEEEAIAKVAPEEIPPERIPEEEIPPEEIWPEKEPFVDEFFIAEQYFRRQQYDLALEAYEEYLLEYPLGNKVKDALARMGTIYYYRNQYGQALPLLEEALKAFPLNDRRAEIHLLIAKIYYQLEKHQESRKTALRWLELYKDYPAKEEVYYLLGQNCMELNEHPRALYWWLKVIESPSTSETKRQALRSQLTDLISSATEAQLEEMAGYAEDSDFIVPIYARLGSFFLRSDRLDEAREAAIELLRLAPDQEWITRGRELLEQIDERLWVDLDVIGCLLPLSGPFAIYGQEVLRGVELGLDLFHRGTGGGPSIELVVKDTEGDPQKAVEQIRELKEQEKAVLVIGPLISKVAEAAVEEAQESGIPIITLSQSEGITSKGEMIFQNTLAPEDQIRSLVNKAMDEMGLERFAILYPANPYGTYFMNLFWDKVEAKGGAINAVESYDPESTDFTTEIKKMVGLFYPRPIEEEEGVSGLFTSNMEKEESEEEPDPIVDFDAVFIPDSHEAAALIASQLAYHDVVDVTLLGTNLWNSPELVETAGRYMRGAIFPSGFFTGSGYPGVDEFVSEYRSSFGQEPGLLAAMGYDTVRIVRETLQEASGQIKTRSDLQTALAEKRTFGSVTGPMSFDEQRRAKRDPLLLTVSGGHFLPMP
jgi:branched-chain amino acid transport system substrate-binding protein